MNVVSVCGTCLRAGLPCEQRNAHWAWKPVELPVALMIVELPPCFHIHAMRSARHDSVPLTVSFACFWMTVIRFPWTAVSRRP